MDGIETSEQWFVFTRVRRTTCVCRQLKRFSGDWALWVSSEKKTKIKTYNSPEQVVTMRGQKTLMTFRQLCSVDLNRMIIVEAGEGWKCQTLDTHRGKCKEFLFFANFLEIIRVPKPIFSHNSNLLNKKKKPEIYFCEFPSAGLGDLKKKKKTDLFQALIACNR